MTTSDLFDRMVDALGPTLAADVMRQVTDYAQQHAGCQLAGADILDTGTDVQVVLAHQPGCPALTGEESTQEEP